MDQTIKLLSKETGLTSTKIKSIYGEYFRAIKLIMALEDFDRDISEEDFLKEKHCFNIIGLGKLGVPYETYKKIYKRKSNDKHKDDTSNV